MKVASKNWGPFHTSIKEQYAELKKTKSTDPFAQIKKQGLLEVYNWVLSSYVKYLLTIGSDWGDKYSIQLQEETRKKQVLWGQQEQMINGELNYKKSNYKAQADLLSVIKVQFDTFRSTADSVTEMDA